MTSFTHTIPTDNVEILTAKIEKLNRRARRAGAPETTLTVVGTENHPHPRIKDMMVEWSTVEVSVGFSNFDGWTLLGVLEVMGDYTMVRAVPGQEVPVEYRERHFCDHCKTARERNKTFVLRHEDGRTVQVGSTCLQSFLPDIDLQIIAEGLDEVLVWCSGEGSEVDEDEEELRGGRSRRSYSFLSAQFLAKVNVVIERDGWMSRSKAGEWDAATVDIVLLSYFSHKPKHQITVTDEQIAAAQVMIEEGRAVLNEKVAAGQVLSDYEYNLFHALEGDSIVIREAGTFASVAQYVGRVRVARAQAKDSKHVGKVGERITVKVNVLREFCKDGEYGVTHIYTMQDEDGNIFTWFSSNGILEERQTVTLKGTVKAHDIFNGKAQTVLTRCKVQ